MASDQPAERVLANFFTDEGRLHTIPSKRAKLLVVGPEVVSGSTRLKAGTAQKMVLNMISTAVMIRLGKTYSNLMVDVQPTNVKLRQRARRIVAEATGLDLQRAADMLSACNGEVKTAIVAILAGVSPEIARIRLNETGGYVRKAIG